MTEIGVDGGNGGGVDSKSRSLHANIGEPSCLTISRFKYLFQSW